jgi:ribosomal protein L40E
MDSKINTAIIAEETWLFISIDRKEDIMKKICNNCGCKNDADSKFCRKCRGEDFKDESFKEDSNSSDNKTGSIGSSPWWYGLIPVGIVIFKIFETCS